MARTSMVAATASAVVADSAVRERLTSLMIADSPGPGLKMRKEYIF
jgi:hypothetical protein